MARVTQPPLPTSPASERNKGPIFDILQHWIGPSGHALEIASGTGQHVAHFAAALHAWTWQPSDVEDGLFGAILARSARQGLRNVLPPLRLDVRHPQWPVEGPEFAQPFNLIYCANMLHIAPWECCLGLMQGAVRHLSPDGLLVTYGPYLEDDVPTAPGNLAFDADLRQRDPRWGIRRLADVCVQAAAAGLALRERVAMPANNLLLAFARTSA